MMKKSLFRPENCLLPLGCIAGALLGQEALTARFFLAYIAVSLFSLCADGAFCIDAARQGSLRQVDRRFCGSLVQLAIGFAIAAALPLLLAQPDMERAHLNGAAALALANQMFVERLHAHNRRRDALLLAFLHMLLIAVGLALNPLTSESGNMILWLMQLGFLISLITFCIVPIEGYSFVPRSYLRAPLALWQNLLYPAALACVGFAHGKMPPVFAMLCGWALWRGARTVCRRSDAESAPLNFWVAAIGAACMIIALFLPQFMWVAACVNLAMLCALAVFARISWRNALGAALLAAALAIALLKPLPQNALYIICSVFSVAAPLINLRHAFLKRV